MKNNKGGKVLASGGFGCVFSPALKCEGEEKRAMGKISKLMSEKHAVQEYEEINSIKQELDTIQNYEDYYLIYDATLCKPAKLSGSDLDNYSKKCTALPKDKITKTNINNKLDKLLSLNIPNGGLPVDDYLYNEGSFEKIYKLHIKLVSLLKNGILPMNEKKIYHCDIKDSNVLVDEQMREMKTRLIDWGLCTRYTPFVNMPFPKSWRNRPLQFNVPFSVIIFSDYFVQKYTDFIANGGAAEETQLKPFVIEYISFWMKERGAGHYKFINEIMYMLFSDSLTNIEKSAKPEVIETQITMNYIVNYIVDVLVHFTDFREDGTLNLREYLDKVFIHIVDIWGFISVYIPIIELLANNYDNLTKKELAIFSKLQFIFVEYLYSPRHSAINTEDLFLDLKHLGDLLKGKNRNSKQENPRKSIKKTVPKIFKKTTTRKNNNLGGSIRRKYKNMIEPKSFVSFKRMPRKRRFKNPFFLSLK